MENIKIVPLNSEFIDDVFSLEKTFFGLKNFDVIKESFSSETLKYFVILYNEKFAGFYERSIVLDEAELFDIAIKEEYQGRGLSNFLIKHFIDECKEKNVRTIFLEVNTINNKAKNLYKKFGFYQYATRKNYYGENDAVLMKCDL